MMFILFLQFLLSCVISKEYPFETTLDVDNKINLKWMIKESTDEIFFNVTLIDKKLPFTFGFGFSNYGEFENADFFVIEVINKSIINGYDSYTNENGVLFKDMESNYEISEYNNTVNEVYVVFKRKIDTCENNDYYIDSGTTHLLYFILDDVNSTIYENYFMPKNVKHGMVRVQLLKSNIFSDEYKKNVLDGDFLEIKNENVKIPATNTTYWCKTYKLGNKFKNKHHITAFEGKIDQNNKGIVHHMELFHCATDPSDENSKVYNSVCTSEEKPKGLRQCRKVIAAWAMGADTFFYPDHVGGVIGGENYSLYLVLEIHYNNVNLKDNIVDNSGIRIYYNKTLREYDAGILEVGLEYNPKNSIPPNLNSFILNGYCLSDCTKLNSKPIKVFASQLHTHLTGKKVWTSVIKRNKCMKILNSDYHYSPEFQEIRTLQEEIIIEPGDMIINSCEYNTKSRKSMTFGGYGITDEMCVNYIHYYPAVQLEACKSSIRDDILNEFFIKMKEFDLANTNIYNQSIEENFNSIRWTPLTSEILNRLYNKAPISFSCNNSAGENILEKMNKPMNNHEAYELPKHDYEQSKRSCNKN